jgi:hypothetical protein
MALIEVLKENGIEPNGLNIAMAKRIFSHWDLIMELKSYCVSNLVGEHRPPLNDESESESDGIIFDLFLGTSNPDDSEVVLAEALRGWLVDT